MDVILWRHAEAEDGGVDEARHLTRKGKDQATRVGRWLRDRVPSYRLLSSPAARARETAEGLDPAPELLPELYAGASVMDVLECAGWPRAEGTVILVGHQPLLGEVAAYLMTRRTESWPVKKGAIWWFRCEETGRGIQTELLAVISPKLA
jgi:phosphohistidine phosphatase